MGWGQSNYYDNDYGNDCLCKIAISAYSVGVASGCLYYGYKTGIEHLKNRFKINDTKEKRKEAQKQTTETQTFVKGFAFGIVQGFLPSLMWPLYLGSRVVVYFKRDGLKKKFGKKKQSLFKECLVKPE